jgi:hypothetical protein
VHRPNKEIRVTSLGSLLAFLVRQGIPFGGFLLVLAFSWVQYMAPLLEMRASQSWPEVECQPLDPTNGSGFHYAYEYGGQHFESDRLSLFDSPPTNLKELHKKFRQGESVTGYVDPSNPRTAILSRDDPPNDERLTRIIVGLVVIVFCGGVTAAWLTGMDKWTAAKAGREKKVSPITRFCECTVYTVLINSFVGIFGLVFLKVPGSFLMKAFLYLVLTPFGLLGLLMIYSTFRNFMLIFKEESSKTAKRRSH